MHNHKWPEWAPMPAIDYCLQCFSDGYLCANDLKKLLTQDIAKDVWVKLPLRKVNVENFCIAFTHAISGHILIDKTPGEYKKFFNQISEKSFELSLLLAEFPEIDEITIKHYFSVTGIDKNNYYPPLLSSQLREVSTISDELKENNPESKLLPQPNNENAQMHYFIRMMTKFFREQSGRPCSDIVELCVEVCFESVEISKKKIEDLTRNI